MKSINTFFCFLLYLVFYADIWTFISFHRHIWIKFSFFFLFLCHLHNVFSSCRSSCRWQHLQSFVSHAGRSLVCLCPDTRLNKKNKNKPYNCTTSSMDKWLHVEINSIMADYNRKTSCIQEDSISFFAISITWPCLVHPPCHCVWIKRLHYPVWFHFRVTADGCGKVLLAG